MGSLKSELEKAVPNVVRALKARPARPLKPIREIYEEFCAKLRDVAIVDPQGRTIVFRIENFPYLIKMEHCRASDNEWVSVRAKVVLKALAGGNFDESRHRYDSTRAKVLPRIRRLLTDPDSIHDNIHPRVAGKLVYVGRFGEGGVKVAFTTKNSNGEWVVVTSFYTSDKWLKTCAKVPPAYLKQKSHP